jgi:hypothetical protein
MPLIQLTLREIDLISTLALNPGDSLYPPNQPDGRIVVAFEKAVAPHRESDDLDVVAIVEIDDRDLTLLYTRLHAQAADLDRRAGEAKSDYEFAQKAYRNAGELRALAVHIARRA